MSAPTLETAHRIPARRERSRMSRDDCLLALERFSKRVVREAEWTGGQPFYDFAPHGHITVTFLVHGSFGVADDIFEAIRVLAGYRLPRKE